MSGSRFLTEQEITHAEVLAKSWFNGADQVSVDRYTNEVANYRSFWGDPITPAEKTKEDRVVKRLLKNDQDFKVGITYRSLLISILNAGSDGASLPVFEFPGLF